MRQSFIICLVVMCASSCTEDQAVRADLVIQNAVIWTGENDMPYAESIAVHADTIIAVGSNESTLIYQGAATKVIDLEGRFIAPGFIDSHVHLMTGGRSLLSVDLRHADSPEAFSSLVKDFVQTIDEGEWILEGNWDHTLWGGELPHKDWIDEVTGENPVLLMRLDWHMALANTAALRYAGIDESTPDVAGGTIERDASGQLTGILKDNAMNLVMKKIPPMSKAYKDRSFQAAMDYFVSQGVTSVHDVDGQNKDVASLSTAQKFRKSGRLKVRIYSAGVLQDWQEVSKLSHKNDDWVRTGSVKGFVDGSLGSHTAAFHNHYTDQDDDKGFFINQQEDLYKWIAAADSAGLHVLVHAIGDRANHTLLNLYERVIAENGERDRRFRIEHAQHLDPEDISRFTTLDVIASMQPYHAIDDGRWAESYIGAERIKTTYAFQSLLEADASIAFGSDWAVAPASPLQGIYAAVTRRTLDGMHPNGWVPKEKITAEQALIAYTKDAAYASFEEDVKGTLVEGKLADFVVLDGHILSVDPNAIKDIKVLQTYVAGEIVYDLSEK